MTTFFSAILAAPLLGFVEDNIQEANEIRPNTIIQHRVNNQDFVDDNYELNDDRTGETYSWVIVEITSGKELFVPKIVNNTNKGLAKQIFNKMSINYKNSYITNMDDDKHQETIYKIGDSRRIFLGQKFLYCNENKNDCSDLNNFILN